MAWATICRKKHQSHSPTPRPSSLAEAIADLDYVLSIIVEHSTEFLPGEAVDEIKSAWSEAEFEISRSSRSISLGRGLLFLSGVVNRPLDPPARGVTDTTLNDHQLTGPVGRAKRGLMKRQFDGFMSHWNIEPRTEERRVGAAEAGADFLEMGATVVSSVAGYEQIVEVISLVRLALEVRARREA